MSKENYERKLAILQGLQNNVPNRPYMPVDTALQEAENLYVWALQDKAALEQAGLNWATWVEDLPVRAGALRYAQSQWMSQRHSQEEAQRNWKTAALAAYELRNDLLADFRFAFRKRDDLLGRVREISQGSGDADMIQDLSDLSALGQANTDELAKINFDESRLNLAMTQAEQMADLLAQANGATQDNSQAKALRDAAFAHLKEAVDEVRETGKYVFRKNDSRFKGYVSQYRKR